MLLQKQEPLLLNERQIIFKSKPYSFRKANHFLMYFYHNFFWSYFNLAEFIWIYQKAISTKKKHKIERDLRFLLFNKMFWKIHSKDPAPTWLTSKQIFYLNIWRELEHKWMLYGLASKFQEKIMCLVSVWLIVIHRCHYNFILQRITVW